MTPAADSSPPRSLELKWERDYARVARLLDAVDATVSHFRPSPSLADVAGSVILNSCFGSIQGRHSNQLLLSE